MSVFSRLPIGRLVLLVALVGTILPADCAWAQSSYLSQLEAGPEAPLFATYAAPLERSEFVVDEGYHLRYYDPGAGIDLRTDHAGHLSLAFKKDDEVRYRMEALHEAPVVTTSYSDLVRYHYFPYDDVRVDVFFQVYSSRLALQDVTVTNTGSETIDLDVYPFLQHPAGVREASFSDDGRAFTFVHDEPVDGWTRGHDVPYEPQLRNVYLLDAPADGHGAYLRLGTADAALATATTARARDNYFVEWGTVRHADGSPCQHRPPEAQQVILHDGDLGEILTEDASKWGDAAPNVPGNGYQGAELGNFEHPPIAVGDAFTVVFTCRATGQQGRATGRVTELPGAVRADVELEERAAPHVPRDLEVRFAQNHSAAVLSWTREDDLSYHVYRRTARTPGRYDRVATVSSNGHMDLGLDPDSAYRYVVVAEDAQGRLSGHSPEAGGYSALPLFSDLDNDSLRGTVPPEAKAVAFQRHLELAPGGSRHLRLVRGVIEPDRPIETLRADAEALFGYDVEDAVRANEALYSQIPHLTFDDPELEMMYWNAFSLMRQVMLPAEGQLSHNYYVFSREPTWGWGHGGQVFHESLTMLAYVFMDPESAVNSQRVYIDTQREDGYINYRTGAFLSEQIYHDGEFTTSAPWFNYINWELYQQTEDRAFLEEAYVSGTKFYEWYRGNRNQDGDALMEWGGHAILESVRDAQVAVWDEVGWPSNFESIDLNVMMVREAQSLAAMAEALDDAVSAKRWRQEAERRTQAVNETFWDEETGFFYQVDRDDHDFTFEQPNDLKRQEIIGFLPLWAGTATEAQAERLVEHLTDPDKFWRPYGIPSLAADDSYYNPQGYWNGPVWVEWQYLIFRGLLDYGYEEEARELARRVGANIINRLKEDHTFWEFYSPDADWGGHHQTYIWTGLIARMFIDLEQHATRREDTGSLPGDVFLEPNYPDPFSDSTTITYGLAAPGPVRLDVYDVTGRQVATLVDAVRPAGRHQIEWAPAEGVLASGLYLYTLGTSGRRLARTMIAF